ncbi:hypothetical protein ACOME3_001719 [Neoechinorhynchus agilis]
MTMYRGTESRNIRHFNYIDWPDFGEPSTPQCFLHFLHECRRAGVFNDPYRPPIVHCSAGVGRSGTFIFVDIVLQMLASEYVSCEVIDLTSLLCDLRSQRMGLIQTPEQLRFCFVAILEAFRCPLLAADIHHSWKHQIISMTNLNTASLDDDLMEGNDKRCKDCLYQMTRIVEMVVDGESAQLSEHYILLEKS